MVYFYTKEVKYIKKKKEHEMIIIPYDYCVLAGNIVSCSYSRGFQSFLVDLVNCFTL